MPRIGPPASGYERLAQQADLSDSDDDESSALVVHSVASIHSPQRSSAHPYSPPTGRHHMRRTKSSSSAVDIKVINARLERWADQIANKFKFKKDRSQHDHPPLEILHSVFVAPEGFRFDGVAATANTTTGDSLECPAAIEESQLVEEQFDQVVDDVRTAISKGIDPKLIKQGSSGSYFMRDCDGKIVAVFKPKDEEPYGKLNPKIMKWLHRTLFPCFFGRSCLIPNLSYISEAAACLLDRRLKTYIVPYTDVVHLSSKAFHYDYWDRRAYYRRRKPLPLKVGSFQVFLEGYQDANIFLRNHPWPDPYNTSFRTDTAPKRRAPWKYTCRPRSEDIDVEVDDESDAPSSIGDRNRKFVWTEALKQSFREELEKLVIIDYIMRNTDRGLDNWMIKVDFELQDVSITSRPVNMNAESVPVEPLRTSSPVYRVQEPMLAASRSGTHLGNTRINIGAIDNSLAFPWKHPDQWRSFPFGWLFLPVSLIGQPFSQKTRDHFIPLLTSTKWWSETQMLLRKLFEQDSDFKERMFQKQLAVLKGQAFNVVETLKSPDQGPLELTRRARVHVWDDEMEVPVAVPLRMPSSEQRKRAERDLEAGQEHGEMDIGALVSSAPVLREYDLLGFSPPKSSIPSSVRLGRPQSQTTSMSEQQDAIGGEDDLSSPSSPTSLLRTSSGTRSLGSNRDSESHPHSHSRVSHDAGLVTSNGKLTRKGMCGGSRENSDLVGYPSGYNEEDAEGDLGYSAVTGSEGARRRVIAERLETVKSRNPVFTWC